ncbi:MAG TPA: putative sugar nucleotidyl transferase, partial [Pirellulaceae bacterium]|nr:putative sugar nucleotidyl transferase [Pirellulaceae bacterium]
MQILVFEDDAPRLYPLTLGRAAYAISCASYRLVDWLGLLAEEAGATLGGLVRPHLRAIQKLDFPQFRGQGATSELPALMVNARVAPTVAAYRILQKLID